MFPNCAKSEDLLKAINDEKVQMNDLRFTDLPGVWQHFSVPPSAVNVDALEEGIGFDGSSIRGFQEIQESDMLVVPDPMTAFLDPFSPATTLVLICSIRDPVTRQSYSRDVRYIAQKAETYLRGTGQADTSYFGPEAEFFVFNDVRYGQDINYAFHEIDSSEGSWNTGKDEGPNLGHKPRPKEGYFPVRWLGHSCPGSPDNGPDVRSRRRRRRSQAAQTPRTTRSRASVSPRTAEPVPPARRPGTATQGRL
jgi:glutamine synthetase